MTNKKLVATLALLAFATAAWAGDSLPVAEQTEVITLSDPEAEGATEASEQATTQLAEELAEVVALTEEEESAPTPETEAAVKVRKLEAHEESAYMPKLICRMEKPTGSRLARKKCYTAARLENEIALRKANVARNSRRFPPRPPLEGRARGN